MIVGVGPKSVGQTGLEIQVRGDVAHNLKFTA
jgi:hypothetical protein